MFAAYSPAAIERSLIWRTRSGGTSPSRSTVVLVREELALGERPHGVDDHLLLVGELEVHGYVLLISAVVRRRLGGGSA